MSMRAALTFLLALLATGCGQDHAVDVSKPEAFSRQMQLQPAGIGKLQRLALPPALIVASKRRDLGDIRLFDARGRLVGMALLAADPGAGTSLTIDLPVYPVLGGREGGRLQDSELSVRVESGGAVRAVTVDRTDAGEEKMPAALLDTRKVGAPIAALILRARVPVGRPVPFTLLASDNLKDWEPFAEQVLFRSSEDGPMLADGRVALGGADLRGRFVGVNWTGSAGVVLEGASAVLAQGAKVDREAVPTAPLTLADPYELILQLPDLDRLSALRVTGAASDGIIPVRLYGRKPGRDSWTALAAATLAPQRGASTVELPAAAMASIRIEADRRTGGFSEPPRVELLFDPVDLLVAISGTPPYRLAVGQVAAPPAFLALSDIAPAMTAADLARLPRATITGADERPLAVDVQSEAASGLQDRRKLLLWGALILGTLVLAGAAFRLVRAGASGAS